jgi:4'-phosphopantetheinyl transferase
MAVPMTGAEPTLQPRPWRLQDPPPLAVPPAPEPLLLLLDCRDPLPPATRADLLATFSAAEHQRHQAYRRSNDRERFLRGRAGLRRLLAAWLGCPPAAVGIEIGAHGKPFCPKGPQFNVSHSGDLILLALHSHCRVGVDVEQLRPGLDWQPIAQRMLTEPQQKALNQLPAPAQLEGFLAQWCALEAELKATGTGLAGLKREPGSALRRWRLSLPAGYLGAVALTLDGAADAMMP